MRAAFDGDGFVNDVALNLCRRGQPHFQAAHPADHMAIDHNIIRNDFAFNGCTFANGQEMGANVAVHPAFHLDVTGGFQIAGDVKVRGQNRCGRFCLWCCGLELCRWLVDRRGGFSAAAASGFADGSLILLLENISSCLDKCHWVYGFTIHADFIVKMGAG